MNSMLGCEQKYIKINWSSSVICATEYLQGLQQWPTAMLVFGSHNSDFSGKKSGSFVNSRPFSYQLALGLHRSAMQPYFTEPAHSATLPASFSLQPTCASECRLLQLNEYSWAHHFTLSKSSWLLKNGCCFIHLWRILGVSTYIGSVAIISCINFLVL